MSNASFGRVAYGCGSAIRHHILEVIVRQALEGAPWRETCEGPMKVNDITPEEVEAEVRRRLDLVEQ